MSHTPTKILVLNRVYKAFAATLSLTALVLLSACSTNVGDDSVAGNLASIEIYNDASRIVPNEPQTLPKTMSLTLLAAGVYSQTTNKTDLTTAVAWRSLDTSVATVDSSGVVTGVEVGQTQITASVAKAGVTGVIDVTVEAAPVVALTISPDHHSLPRGKSVQYTATATRADASTADFTDKVEWLMATLNPDDVDDVKLCTRLDIATTPNPAPETLIVFDSTTGSEGLANTEILVPDSAERAADNGGCAKVVASYFEPAYGLTVRDINVVDIRPAEVEGLSVTPGNLVLNPGIVGARQYLATAQYTDGVEADYTNSAVWASSNQVAATVDASGYVTGASDGETTISANADVFGTQVTGSARLVVTTSPLNHIDVTPTDPNLLFDNTLPQNTTLAMSATGVFDDGRTQDLTEWVSWSSSDVLILTVEDTIAGAKGSVTAKMEGVAQVIATGQPTGQPPTVHSGSTTITITPAPLESIVITPSNPGLSKGNSLRLKAIGHFTGLPSSQDRDMTEEVEWSSADPAFVSISNTAGTKGIITGEEVTVGSVVVTATITPNNRAPLSISANVVVNDPSLMTVDLTHAPVTSGGVASASLASIAKNTQLQFILTGNYSDGSTQVLTNSYRTVYTVNQNPAGTVTIDNGSITCPDGITRASGHKGLLTALGPGSSVIFGRHKGLTNQYKKSLGVSVVVKDIVLSSIAIEEADAGLMGMPLIVGDSRQYRAIGTFSDGSTQDITGQVTWGVDDAAVATIENDDVYAACSNKPATIAGQLTALTTGQVNITAVDPVGGISATRIESPMKLLDTVATP